MSRRHYLLLVLGVLPFLRRALGKPEPKFAVIVHRSNQFDALNRSKVSLLFLRKVSRWPWGAEVEPIDLRSPGTARQQFTREVLGATEEQLAVYWIDQRATRGVKPPAEVRDAKAVKAIVATRAGAIAYIPASELDDSVKAIRVE